MTDLLLALFLIFVCWMAYREIMKVEKGGRFIASVLSIGVPVVLYAVITFSKL